MEVFDRLKQIVKACAEKRGIQEYELYYSESSSVRAETFREEISAFSSNVGGTLYFRCIVGDKMGYASTQYLDEAEMEKLVERAMENATVIEKDEESIIYAGAPAEAYHQIPVCDFTMPTAAAIRERAMQDRNLLYEADEQMADGTSSVVYASESRACLFNSSGLDLSSTTGNTGEYFRVVLDNGTEKQADGDAVYNSLHKDDTERKEKIAESVTKARAKFGAGTVKTGKYNIVFQNDQMEQILATFLPVFYAQNAQKGLSLLRGKVGESIAADCITITDDPFCADNTIQLAFDGEGVPTRTKTVVEKGVLKTMLYNLASAKKDGVETTGNAARTADSIATRAYTFYIHPGKMTREELLCQAGEGLYITGMKGFHAGANAVTGDFSIESEGFILENGRIGSPVKSFTVAGNFFTLLKEITAVDDELDMGGPGGTRICAPDVLVPGMSVAGE